MAAVYPVAVRYGHPSTSFVLVIVPPGYNTSTYSLYTFIEEMGVKSSIDRMGVVTVLNEGIGGVTLMPSKIWV